MVAKDLSFVQISGKTRVGYDLKELVDVLERFLGFTKSHKAFLFGVGSLGGALMHDNGLEQFGLEIAAGFDVKHELTGTSINRYPFTISIDLKSFRKKQVLTLVYLPYRSTRPRK